MEMCIQSNVNAEEETTKQNIYSDYIMEKCMYVCIRVQWERRVGSQSTEFVGRGGACL